MVAEPHGYGCRGLATGLRQQHARSARARTRHRHLPQGKWRDVPGGENFDLLGQFEIKAIGDRLREMAGNPSCDEITFEERMTPPAYTPRLARQPHERGIRQWHAHTSH